MRNMTSFLKNLVCLALVGMISGGASLVSAKDWPVEYFEKQYEVKLTDIKPIEEYPDPDQYYTAIAKQLKIPQKAFKILEKEKGWKKEEGKVVQSIVRRSSVKAEWQVLIFSFEVDPTLGKPSPETIQKSMEMLMVIMDDKGKARITDPEKERERIQKEEEARKRQADKAGAK